MANQIVARNNPVLVSVVLGYMNEADMFIVQKLLKSVPVGKLTGDIKTYGRDHLRILNTVVKDATRIMLSHSVTKAAKWNIENHELTSFITEEDADQVDDVELLKADFTEMNTEALMLSREAAVCDILCTVANYASNNTTSLSGTTLWSDFTNSTPRQDILTAIEAVRTGCGRYPNRCVVNPTVLNYMMQHPQLRDAAMHVGDPTASMDYLKKIMFPTYKPTDCEILVGMAQYNSSAKNQTAVMADLWDKVFILAYVNPAPQPRQHQNSLGYCFGRGKQNAVQVIEWHDAEWRDNEWMIKTRWEYDDVVFLNASSKIDTAYLIANAV